LSPKFIFDENNPLTDDEKSKLRDEAINFEQTMLWQFFKNRVRQDAFSNFIYTAKKEEDMRACQTMLLNLETLQSLIKMFKNMK